MGKKRVGKLAVCLLGFFLAFLCVRELAYRQPMEFSKNLDKVVLTVDEQQLLLRDLAIYIVYQEREIQKNALIYDTEQPKRFWNIHTNGHYLRKIAEDAVLRMAVHDELFYRLAKKDELVLDEEEEAYLANEIMDFCGDLSKQQYERLGVSEEELAASLRKIALANKYQSILSQIEGVDYEAYHYTGECFDAMVKEHKIKVNEKVWDRITVGKVTVNY